MQDTIRIRDIRTLPFFWIQRALLEVPRLSWKAILAYNALAYYAVGERSSCRDVGIKVLAVRVGVSEQSMRRGLAELTKIKAIRIKPRFTSKGGKRQQLSNEYILVDLEPKRPTKIPV